MLDMVDWRRGEVKEMLGSKTVIFLGV